MIRPPSPGAGSQSVQPSPPPAQSPEAGRAEQGAIPRPNGAEAAEAIVKSLEEYSVKPIDDDEKTSEVLNIKLERDLFTKVPSPPKRQEKSLDTRLNQIRNYFQERQYQEVIKQAGLLKKSEGIDKEVLTYLEKMELFGLLNKDPFTLQFTRLTDVLPIYNQSQFIDWHLAIGNAFSEKSPCLRKFTKIQQLCCYLRAADAGSVLGSYYIVKEMLFHKTAGDIVFEVDEVMRHLTVLANNPSDLGLVKEGEERRIIEKLVGIIRNNDPGKRKGVADQLSQHWDYRVRLLAPMVWLRYEFGDYDVKNLTRVISFCERSTRSLKGIEKEYYLNMCKLWSSLGCERDGKFSQRDDILSSLTRDKFVPALLVMMYANYTAKHWKQLNLDCIRLISARAGIHTVNHPSFSFFYRTSLVQHQLPECWREIEKLRKLNKPVDDLSAKAHKLESTVKQLEEAAIEYCHPGGRVVYLTSYLEDYFENKQKYHQGVLLGSIQALPERFCHILDGSRFSNDPEIKVFRHFQQCMAGEVCNEELIHGALKTDRFMTLYRLSALNHCTASMNCQQVLSELVEEWVRRTIDFRNISFDLSMTYILQRLLSENEYLKDRFEAVSMANTFADIMGFSGPQLAELYWQSALAYNRSHQWKYAQEQLSKYYSSRGTRVETVPRVTYTVEFPKDFLPLSRINPESGHPLDIQVKARQLLHFVSTGIYVTLAYLWHEKVSEFLFQSGYALSDEVIDELYKKTLNGPQNICLLVTEDIDGFIEILKAQKSSSVTLSLGYEVRKQVLSRQYKAHMEDPRVGSLLSLEALPRTGESVLTYAKTLFELDCTKEVGQALHLLEKCLDPPRADPNACDPFAIAVRAIPLFEKAASSHQVIVNRARDKLLHRLEQARLEIANSTARLEGKLILAMSRCNALQTGFNFQAPWVEREMAFTAFALKHPVLAVEIIEELQHEIDADFFLFMKIACSDCCQQVAAIAEHFQLEPRKAAEHVRAMCSQTYPGKELKRLRRFTLNESNANYLLLRFMGDVISGIDTKTSLESLLKKRAEDQDKASVLRLALALGGIDTDLIKAQADLLEGNSVAEEVLRIELAKDIAEVNALTESGYIPVECTRGALQRILDFCEYKEASSFTARRPNSRASQEQPNGVES